MLRLPRRALHAPAMARLRGCTTPVIVIDLLRDGPGAIDFRDTAMENPLATRVTALAPPVGIPSVLLGDPQLGELECIIVSEHASAEQAHESLSSRASDVFDDGSLSLLATAMPEFAGVQRLGDEPPEPPALDGPRRRPSDAPFRDEPGADPAAWDALLSVPAEPMLAFNLIRYPQPEPAAYRAYAQHFAPLPARYGMRLVAAGALSPDPREAVLAGDVRAAEELGLASHDLFVLAFFPSTRAFLHAWSDPELVRAAYPLRAPMREDGFRHVWLRGHDLAGPHMFTLPDPDP